MLEKLPEGIGQALRNQRAGMDNVAFNLIDLRTGTAAITLTSQAFNDHEPIPARCTADGDGVSPQLAWTGIPLQAASLVLIVEDADAPTPHPLVHAIAAGIAPTDGVLPEGSLNAEDQAPEGVKLGRNSYLRAQWLPPDPPPGHGTHRYVFQLFALDAEAVLPDTPGREAILKTVEEHAIASGCLVGTYARPDGSVKAGAADVVATGGGMDALPS